MNRRRLLMTTAGTLYVGLLLAFLDSCGRGANAGTGGGSIELEIACDGNNLAFDPDHVTVKAGQRVRITFANVSTAFQHNWVLVEGGADVVEAFNEAATAAGPRREYIPVDTSAILAHTGLIGPGETERISFAAPPSGEYTYVCTFPGHYLAGMRGTLVVEADA